MLFDIIRFSDINTHYDVKQGDACLLYVVNRLSHLFGENSLVGRLTSDVIAVVLTTNCTDTHFRNHYQHVLEHFKHPIAINGHHMVIDFNVGAATVNTLSVDMNRLLAGAEAALKSSKSNQFQNFHTRYLSAKKTQSDNITLKTDLHRALEQSELELYFQPKVNLNNGDVIGAECLLRWHHPEHGLIFPGQLIEATESYNMMNELGYWVMIQAFKAARDLQRLDTPIVLSVNMSPTQLYDASFAANLSRLARTYGVDMRYIQLELTEDIVLSDSVLVRNQLTTLRDMGLTIAMDDFGKGYSNLSYVRDLTLDTIKVDKSFVLGIIDNPINVAIIEAINIIADAMNANVVAEGIETQQQLRSVKESNVNIGQGFLFSPAVPFTEFLAMCGTSYFSDCVEQSNVVQALNADYKLRSKNL